MGRQQGPAQGLPRNLLDQVVDQLHIAQALGHLLGVQGQEAVVHPVAGEIPVVVGADPLGHLVLVVREDQVVAAPVQVHRQAQRRLDHGRALDMPAGPPGAPGAVPGGLARLRRLPQDEVGGVALVGRDLHPGAGDHVVQGTAGQAAIVGEAGRVEQHVPFGGIGVAPLDQLADHGQHLGDVRRGPGLEGGRKAVQGGHIVIVDLRKPLGDHRDVHPLLHRRGVDLVVHVGDVAGVDHVLGAIEPAQQAERQVEHHRGPGVADMGVVPHGGAADIERHPVRVAGLERALLAGEGILDHEGHGAASTRFAGWGVGGLRPVRTGAPASRAGMTAVFVFMYF